MSSATVRRAPDFRDSGEYIVTLPSGREIRIYRDVGSSLKPWYIVGADHYSIGFTKAEAVESLSKSEV